METFENLGQSSYNPPSTHTKSSSIQRSRKLWKLDQKQATSPWFTRPTFFTPVRRRGNLLDISKPTLQTMNESQISDQISQIPTRIVRIPSNQNSSIQTNSLKTQVYKLETQLIVNSTQALKQNYQKTLLQYKHLKKQFQHVLRKENKKEPEIFVFPIDNFSAYGQESCQSSCNMQNMRKQQQRRNILLKRNQYLKKEIQQAEFLIQKQDQEQKLLMQEKAEKQKQLKQYTQLVKLLQEQIFEQKEILDDQSSDEESSTPKRPSSNMRQAFRSSLQSRITEEESIDESRVQIPRLNLNNQ